VDVSSYGRGLLAAHGLNVLGGLNAGIGALGRALRWQENRGRVRRLTEVHGTCPVAVSGPWSEAQARRLLETAGVPVVPGGLAGSAEQAVEIARRVGLPVALKICSAQITHKSDIGGVALGLGTEADVRAAYVKVRAAGDAVPGASIDGVLVTAMRSGGAELLAGVTVDPAFGPVLAVGLGGIWVEVLNDTSLRVLPVDAAEVKTMLGELRGQPLLQGARGTQPADLDAVAGAIAALSNAALSLSGGLRELEVNPLWVNGDQVEALDVLVVTSADGSADGSSGMEQAS
jgi:succinyl-CoA synthetase beta subunit